MSTLCLSSVVGGCCGCLEGLSDELPGKHGAGGLLRQSYSTPAGPEASFHRSLDKVLISGEGRVNPREKPSGKASWRQWCFNQVLESGEDVP